MKTAVTIAGSVAKSVTKGIKDGLKDEEEKDKEKDKKQILDFDFKLKSFSFVDKCLFMFYYNLMIQMLLV